MLSARISVFNVVAAYAVLQVHSLSLSNAKSNFLSKGCKLADPKRAIKTCMRLRGGDSDKQIDEADQGSLIFKVRCSNTRWGQSGTHTSFFHFFCFSWKKRPVGIIGSDDALHKWSSPIEMSCEKSVKFYCFCLS